MSSKLLPIPEYCYIYLLDNIAKLFDIYSILQLDKIPRLGARHGSGLCGEFSRTPRGQA